MTFSVLIATRNRRDVLTRTLDALFAQEFPAGDYELVVVDDGSTDGTPQMLERLEPRCRLTVLAQPHRGLPAARNAALAAAAGEFVLILDDDIICSPGVLTAHAERHAIGGDRVVFGPVPLHPDSPPGLVAESWTEWSDRFLDSLAQGSNGAGPGAFRIAATSPAVNRSMRRSLLASLGGCDEAMKDCHEDWDLGIRLWKAGVPFDFQPAAVAYHLQTKSDRDLVQSDARLFAKGEVALSRKHGEYRQLSALASIGGGRLRHRALVSVATRLPFPIDYALRLPFLALSGLRQRPAAGRAAARLLGYRSSVEIYREAARCVGSHEALRREFGVRLPVLAYHHVGTPKPGSYEDLSVSPARFAQHVRWLHRRGYRSISPAEWVQWVRHGTPLPPKPVILTFDDAFADIAEHALPVLQRYGFGATVFVPTDHIGGTNAWDEARGSAIHPLMSASQLREWADRGIELGAHGRTHCDLAAVPPAVAAQELAASRRELAPIGGRAVTACAYPYGSYSDGVCDSARELFDVAFTTDEGLNGLDTDLFRLRRTCVGHRDTVVDLEYMLRFGTRPLARGRARLARRVQAIAAGV